MKKLLLFILLLLGVFFILPQDSQTVERVAVCDLCGFCVSPTPQAGGPIPYVDPSNMNAWNDCVKCLYPSCEGSAPGSFCTIKINPDVNRAPTPHVGNYHTMLGCIKTEGGFRNNPEGAGSLANIMLNTLFAITGGITFLYIIYGSFLVLTSEGNPERLNKGKRVLYGAIAGALFTVFSVFIVNLIGSGVLKLPGFGE